MSKSAPFVTDPVRLAIAIAYSNAAFIADRVCPKVEVGAREFKWIEYDTQERFTIPDTMVDRKGAVNQVEFTGTEQASICVDYALEDVIPNEDIRNAQNTNFDPEGHAVEQILELVMLGREQRVASMIHNAANYAAGLKETLAAGDMWSAATSDPIEQITAALEKPLMRPNTMTLNGTGLLALRRNKAIVRSFNGNTGEDGMVPVGYLQELFELNIIAGRARYSAANPGQAMSLEYLWKPDAALTYINPSAMPNKGVTFAITATNGGRRSLSKPVDVGLDGGVCHRTGESLKELILATDCAYYIENVATAA